MLSSLSELDPFSPLPPSKLEPPTCIHTYTRTCVHTYMHTHMRTYIRAHAPPYARTYIQAYIHAYPSPRFWLDLRRREGGLGGLRALPLPWESFSKFSLEAETQGMPRLVELPKNISAKLPAIMALKPARYRD